MKLYSKIMLSCVCVFALMALLLLQVGGKSTVDAPFPNYTVKDSLSGQAEPPCSDDVKMISRLSFATASSGYIVETAADGYSLLTPDTATHSFTSLTALFENIPEGADVIFSAVCSADSINIIKPLRLSGELTLTEGNISVGADTVFSELTLRLEKGSVRVREGSLTVEGNTDISALGASALIIDRTSGAIVNMYNGIITQSSSEPAVRLSMGTLAVLGGTITSRYSSAIDSTATLMLSGAPEISGYGAAVVTDNPIRLSAEGIPFEGSLSVCYKSSFNEGSFTSVFLSARESNAEDITLTDKNGEEYAIRYFESTEYSEDENILAVYLPFVAEFYIDNKLCYTDEYIRGEIPSPPVANEKEGFSFLGWYSDGVSDSPYSFSSAPDGSIKLYGRYSLVPPQFTVSSVRFVYDGNIHPLTFSSLYHPLMDKGAFSFEWLKDGVSTGISSRELPLKLVSDSGSYKCKVTFAYNGEFSVAETLPVSVEILKKPVTPPSVVSKEYSSYPQTPDIPKSVLYTAFCDGGTDVGEYPVALTLTDSENYCWSEEAGDVLMLSFSITKAENMFLSAPTVSNSFEGIPPTVTGAAYFGEPRFLYASSPEGVWSENAPTAAGVYYFKAEVPECKNYFGLCSEIIAFTVEEETVVGIKIDTPPDKTEYFAFERLTLDGIKVLATYNSGRVGEIDASLLFVYYPSADMLLVGDSSVNILYDGHTVPLAVSVKRASYDLSGISFSDTVVTYDGLRHTATASGSVTGLDGIPLAYKVIGGGTEAGVYTLSLKFTSQSPNYDTPEAISVTLTILPREVYVEYSDLTFTYDKSSKIPSAYLTLVEELTIPLSLSGAATGAGSYTATVQYSNPNYIIMNPTVSFEITKADIDLSGVAWSGTEFVYSGAPVEMTLTGLPEGVSVIGYSDGSFVGVGEYTTEAALYYDERNYNPPEPQRHTWRIVPAEYDMSGVSIEDSSFIYDGELHYPVLIGSLPVGADGSRPEVRYSSGVRNVSEGRVVVSLSFITDSRNYNAPSALTAYVEILPLSVEVSWGSLSFVYDGSAFTPTATLAHCGVNVVGRGTDAGDYVAVAYPESSNYTITNSRVSFTVERCENRWLIAPSVHSIYYGKPLAPTAQAVYGRVEYLYYKEDTAETVAMPTEAGRYSMIARVPQGKNYKELISEPVSFEIIPIIAVDLKVDLGGYIGRAFSEIPKERLTVYTVNNDGSAVLKSPSEIEIIYQSGALPLFRDSYITVVADGISKKVSVRVDKASYDMSGVQWINTVHTYDGGLKEASLSGLPEGVKLVAYSFNSATDAGSYKLSARLSFDSENYYEPQLPDGWLIINKRSVVLPTLTDFTYDGRLHSPDLKESELYTVKITEGKSVGEYSVIFTLKDAANYCFVSDSAQLTDSNEAADSFSILPRPITLKVMNDGESYQLIKGSLAEGDTLGVEYYSEDGFIYLRSDNKNYDITVIPLKDTRTRVTLWLWLTIFLGALLIALATFALFTRREGLKLLLVEAKRRYEEREPRTVPTVSLMAVDEEHANAMLTDTDARSLIRREPEAIRTRGTRRVAVNLDTVSESFNAGDTVDINSMKDKGIIPKNALSVKVLARGVIDKPLTVIANSFSLSAVKMIALTGGRAVTGKTEKIR